MGLLIKHLSKMMNLQHQLLKLENAALQQGQEQKRKSETNTKNFKNTTTNQIHKAKQYFNTTEILNKQTLPLQQIYKQKAQEYFKQKMISFNYENDFKLLDDAKISKWISTVIITKTVKRTR